VPFPPGTARTTIPGPPRCSASGALEQGRWSVVKRHRAARGTARPRAMLAGALLRACFEQTSAEASAGRWQSGARRSRETVNAARCSLPPVSQTVAGTSARRGDGSPRLDRSSLESFLSSSS
jgi:hypothetical protein